VKQYSWALWSLLEGAWFCQAAVEKQEGIEGWGRWHCCSVWAGVLCMVLCGWDCWSRVYIYWLLCLSAARRRMCHWSWTDKSCSSILLSIGQVCILNLPSCKKTEIGNSCQLWFSFFLHFPMDRELSLDHLSLWCNIFWAVFFFFQKNKD
jgi:hypothetical protein